MATGQKNWLIEQGIDVHDSIQSMVEWEMPDKTRFNQTLLTNWIDPESTTAMSDQKLKFVGTRGRFEANQKDRGVNLIFEDEQSLVPNPDFCQPYGAENGSVYYQGYGIDSIVTFLNDVNAIKNGTVTPSEFEGLRPTFAEALYSTAVVDTAIKSLTDNGEWKQVKSL